MDIKPSRAWEAPQTCGPGWCSLYWLSGAAFISMMAMLCYRNEQVVRAVNQGLTDAHRSETLLWSDSAKQGLMLRYIYVAVQYVSYTPMQTKLERLQTQSRSLMLMKQKSVLIWRAEIRNVFDDVGQLLCQYLVNPQVPTLCKHHSNKQLTPVNDVSIPGNAEYFR